MPAPANRLSNLPSYVFAVIGDRLRAMEKEGKDVIRLDVGSPDLPPPPAVIETLYASASRPDRHGYSGYRGTPQFREAVSRYYQARFEVNLDPDSEILPLIGSKEGIVNLCLAYLDKGDTVIIPDVGYPSYAQGAKLAGADIYWTPVRAETGYLIDFDSIPEEVASKAKILWVNYPNNPTGATADLDFYARAVDFCARHGILLASDNPYVDVTFDNYRAPSALEVPGAKETAIEFMSFSKTHNMAGWRLGAAVGNAEALKVLLKVKSNLDSGHFLAVFDAGITALDDTPEDWIAWRNGIYQARRDRIMAALPHIGLSAATPLGSLYIWAKPDKISAETYVEEALSEALVSFAPGGAYGPGGNDYVRLSLGVSDERLDQALERLKAWYSAKHG